MSFCLRVRRNFSECLSLFIIYFISLRELFFLFFIDSVYFFSDKKLLVVSKLGLRASSS